MTFTENELETIITALEEYYDICHSKTTRQKLQQVIDKVEAESRRLYPDSKLPLITIQRVNENSEYDGPNTDPITHYLVRRTETELETIDSDGEEWGFAKSQTGGDSDLWYEINSEGVIRVLDAAP